MISAAFKALGDLLSPEFRSVLFKAIGMTLALFIAILVGVEVLLAYLDGSFPGPGLKHWRRSVRALVLLVAFFFMMAPVTAIFAGLYLDDVAGRVEAQHYRRDPGGMPLSGFRAVQTSLQFALIILVVNLAVLPLVFTGIGAVGADRCQRLSAEPRIFRNDRHAPHGGRRGAPAAQGQYAADFCGRLGAGAAVDHSDRESGGAAVCDILLHAHLQAGAGVFCLNWQRSAMRQRQHSGLRRLADIAPMQDQPVMGMAQILFGNDFQQSLLDLQRSLSGRQPGAVSKTKEMRIDGDGGFAENDVENHIGGLAPDAGQGFQSFALARNFACHVSRPEFLTGRSRSWPWCGRGRWS